MGFQDWGCRARVVGVVKVNALRKGKSKKTGEDYTRYDFAVAVGDRLVQVEIDDTQQALCASHAIGSEVVIVADLVPHYKEQQASALRLVTVKEFTGAETAPPQADGGGLLGLGKRRAA